MRTAGRADLGRAGRRSRRRSSRARIRHEHGHCPARPRGSWWRRWRRSLRTRTWCWRRGVLADRVHFLPLLFFAWAVAGALEGGGGGGPCGPALFLPRAGRPFIAGSSSEHQAKSPLPNAYRQRFRGPWRSGGASERPAQTLLLGLRANASFGRPASWSAFERRIRRRGVRRPTSQGGGTTSPVPRQSPQSPRGWTNFAVKRARCDRAEASDRRAH